MTSIVPYTAPSWWAEGRPPSPRGIHTLLRNPLARFTTSTRKLTDRRDLEMVSRAYIQAQECQICTTGRSRFQSDLVYPQELLESASQKNCAGCMMLCGILSAFGESVFYDTLSQQHVLRNEPFAVKDYGATIKIRNDFSLNVFAMPHDPSPSPWKFPTLPKSMSQASGELDHRAAVRYTRAWLKNCNSQAHKQCKKIATRLPTRVIEIFEDFKSVRLSDGKGRAVPYLCLSHCWGDNDFIRTTKQTVCDFRKKIPWDDLPRSFQHAIWMTDSLGYKYLWIDSLCIIQDDIMDWRQEGGRMSDIYSNSILTISATSSASASDGCFDPESESSAAIYSYPDPKGILRRVNVRRKIDHSRWVFGHFPLLKRGWTLQERLLSPRVIHFVDNEVIWECRSLTDCQCGTVHREDHILGVSGFHEALSANRQNLGEIWRLIVEEYTRRKLSYEKDIFPALQGVAKQFHSRTGSEYLAGLWEETIIHDLLWRCTTMGRPEQWRAPSWTWASVSGPVQWVTFGARTRALVHYSANCIIPIGNDAFGEISSGELVLKGCFLPSSIEIPVQEPGVAIDHGYMYESGLGHHDFWYDAYPPAHAQALPLAQVVAQQEIIIYGLMLRRSTKIPQFFERVGLFSIRSRNYPLDALLDQPEREIHII